MECDACLSLECHTEGIKLVRFDTVAWPFEILQRLLRKVQHDVQDDEEISVRLNHNSLIKNVVSREALAT